MLVSGLIPILLLPLFLVLLGEWTSFIEKKKKAWEKKNGSHFEFEKLHDLVVGLLNEWCDILKSFLSVLLNMNYLIKRLNIW